MSNHEIEDPDSMNDARLLNFTMRKREEIVNKLTADNKLPDEKSDKVMLMSALDGIDRTILTRSRIKADTKIADSNAQATALIANILNNVSAKNVKSLDANRTIPVLTIENEGIVFIEGEKDTGTQNCDFDTFMAKFPNQQD